jgi:ECF sigma factor/WD40-like Beta Propeller Repeat
LREATRLSAVKPSELTVLLRAWSAGDEGARERLMPLVYQELRRRAAAHLRRERRDHTLQPTALVNEVYLKLVDQDRAVWLNRSQFFGVASQMMRRVLVDHARAGRMAKRSPSFSRDGARIAFVTDRRGDGSEVWTVNADGTQPRALTRGTQRTLGSPRWSPDGQLLAFDGKGEDGTWHVWVIDARGGQPRRLTSGPFAENLPSWSKDGVWVYVGSARAGNIRTEVWRVRLRDGEAEQITHAGGSAPLESPDGKTLYFIRSGKLFAIELPNGPEREVLSTLLGWEYWPVQQGLFYIPPAAPGQPQGTFGLFFLDFLTGKNERRGTFQFQYLHGGFSVSPDGKTVLLNGVARIGVNLMLVENFR